MVIAIYPKSVYFIMVWFKPSFLCYLIILILSFTEKRRARTTRPILI